MSVISILSKRQLLSRNHFFLRISPSAFCTPETKESSFIQIRLDHNESECSFASAQCANQLHLIGHYFEPLAVTGSYANEETGCISRLAEYLWLNLQVDLGAERTWAHESSNLRGGSAVELTVLQIQNVMFIQCPAAHVGGVEFKSLQCGTSPLPENHL